MSHVIPYSVIAKRWNLHDSVYHCPYIKSDMGHFDRRCLERVGRVLNKTEIIKKIRNNEIPQISWPSEPHAGVRHYLLSIGMRKSYRIVTNHNNTHITLLTIIPFDTSTRHNHF